MAWAYQVFIFPLSVAISRRKIGRISTAIGARRHSKGVFGFLFLKKRNYLKKASHQRGLIVGKRLWEAIKVV